MIPRLLFSLLALTAFTSAQEKFVPDIAANITRPWPGKDFWANPAEDWHVAKGRLENTFSGGNRNIVLLTAEVGPGKGTVNARFLLDQVSFELFGDGFAGFQAGLRAPSGDFREAAVLGTGFAAGIDFTGRPFIGTAKSDADPLPLPLRGLLLELKAEPAAGELYDLTLLVQDATGKILRTVSTSAHESWLPGLIAMTASSQPAPAVDLTAPRPNQITPLSQKREGEGRFGFSKLEVAGTKLQLHPDRSFGPILWTTYTFDNDGTLCLLAQAAPFARSERHEAELLLPGRSPASAVLDPSSRTARFRLLKLDPTREIPFEVKLAGGSYKGTIRSAAPGRPLKIASLSCNDSTGFPHLDLVANVAAQSPDFITFHGDQIYEAIGGYGLIYDHRPGDRALLSYLRKYAMHGWTWRELLRDRPSITIPDDHDVFHGNLWGAGGDAADVSRGYGNPAQDSGGYKMSVEFVNAVHRTQTGNLPDPADPSPCRSGMSVYFTRHAWGPLDFVVLADRQFKSAPRKMLPDGKIENGWPQAAGWDPRTQADAPEADLLGIRQETYLARWAGSPARGAKFRIALSQTPFCAPQTLPKEMRSDAGVPDLRVLRPGEYAPDDEAKADFDTNGWPGAARLRALKLLAEARAVHITGDQHLGSTGQYGLDSWGDGPWWISSPAIANVWPRRWMPAIEGKNRRPDAPKWTGDFEDGFGNKISIHAVANPHDIDREPARLFDRAVGYTLTTWDPASGKVRLENWPYWASPAQPAPDNQPYPGWPVTIDPSTGKRLE